MVLGVNFLLLPLPNHFESGAEAGTARNLLLAGRSRKSGLGGRHGGERGLLAVKL